MSRCALRKKIVGSASSAERRKPRDARGKDTCARSRARPTPGRNAGEQDRALRIAPKSDAVASAMNRHFLSCAREAASFVAREERSRTAAPPDRAAILVRLTPPEHRVPPAFLDPFLLSSSRRCHGVARHNAVTTPHLPPHFFPSTSSENRTPPASKPPQSHSLFFGFDTPLEQDPDRAATAPGPRADLARPLLASIGCGRRPRFIRIGFPTPPSANVGVVGNPHQKTASLVLRSTNHPQHPPFGPSASSCALGYTSGANPWPKPRFFA